MALGIIRIDGRYGRPALIAAALACIFLAVFSAIWCFANGASVRAELKEVANLMTDLAPDDPQTHFAAAVLYEKTFEPADAIRSLQEYEKAAALAPNNYLIWLELGKAREHSGDRVGAERALLRTLELAPNYAAVQWAYGNMLIRDGRMDEGFAMIRQAAAARPEYMNSAAVTAMSLLDGDIEQVRNALGDTGAVNSGLAVFLFGQKRYDDAAASWGRVPQSEKREKYRQIGESLSSQFAGARQFRLAARIAGEIRDDQTQEPRVGDIFNGGFESGVKFKDAGLFDWQIAAGADPQIGLSNTQRHDGAYSLYLIFNTMQAADLRSIAQTAAVEPGSAYSLEAFYRAELKGAVAWEIIDATDGKSLARSTPIGSAADWSLIRADFTVPQSSDGITVRLVRDGCTSSVCPISGKLWLDDISLKRHL